MSLSYSASRSIAAITVLLLATAISARAHVVFDFSAGTDDGWERYDPLGVASFSFPDGAYRIYAGASPDASFGPGRAGSAVAGVTVTDFVVSVDLVSWDATLQQSFGIMARASEIGPGTSNGYFLNYSPGPASGRPNGSLAINVLIGEVPQLGGAFSIITPDLDPSVGYRMVFEGVGDTLTGSIYALDDLNSALVSISATDETFSSGLVGLLVTDSSVITPSGNPLNAADATFNNFAVVPEPSFAALFVGAGTLVIGLSRRRLRKA